MFQIMKQAIGLVVDEGADLPKEIIERYQIETVPVKLDWPDVQKLPGENIYQKMREADKRGIISFGKTSQPSPKDFLVVYRKQLENFKKIISITLTSKLSGTYNSAVQAKSFLSPEEQNRVFTVDSLSVSGGEALVALRAIDLIKEEKGTEQITEILKELPPKIYLRVIFKDPKWVAASGRISKVTASWIRRIQRMNVHPLLGVKKGIIKPVGIKIGAKDIPAALFREIKEKTKKSRGQNKKIMAIINHGDDLKEAQKLKEMIENNLRGVNVLFINLVNDIVGTLAGPDALALSWTEG